MTSPVMKLRKDELHGTIGISASVPNGDMVLTRTQGRIPEIIRGGEATVTTGGVILDDPEPSFGIPITYRLAIALSGSRFIQSNRITNPRMAVNTTGWTTSPGRTLAREAAAGLIPARNALTSLRISDDPSGSTGPQTMRRRQLAATVPDAFGSGRWWLTGQVRYFSPVVRSWTDVTALGTWQTVKNSGTWQTVKSSSTEQPTDPFVSLWAMVAAPTDTTVETRRNRIPNPRGATNATGWSVNAGTGGTAAVTQVATGGPDGGTFVRATWSVAATALGTGQLRADGRNTSALPIPVTPGQILSMRMDVRSSLAQRAALVITWFDATGGQVGITTTSASGAAQVLAANTWTTLTATNVTVPAGAAYCLVGPQAVTGTGAVLWTVGSTLDASLALLQIGATVGAFFSGASAAAGDYTYSWAGTANASQSIERAIELTAVSAPFQILGVQADTASQWRTFQGWVDVPAGMPAGSRLVFLHGTDPREFNSTWWLSTVLMTPEAEALGAGAVLPYFDGDSVVPVNPARNLLPGYDWFPVVNDAYMAWTGTANASRSVFYGPSQVYSEITTILDAPPPSEIGHKYPVMLSDPVTPLLGAWFELLEIGDLSFAARAEIFDILGRGAQVSVSQVRAWPGGEMRLLTRTDDQRELVERLFASGRILFHRTQDPRLPENRWYMALGTVTNGRLHAQQAWRPERIWRVPFIKVERPEGLIATATAITWADVKGQFTWAELRQAREDWLDVAIEDVSA